MSYCTSHINLFVYQTRQIVDMYLFNYHTTHFRILLRYVFTNYAKVHLLSTIEHIIKLYFLNVLVTVGREVYGIFKLHTCFIKYTLYLKRMLSSLT